MNELSLQATPIPGALPAFHASIAPSELRAVCEKARALKARLVALWGSDETARGGGYALHLALALPAGLLWLSVPLAREDPGYPSIADLYPCANRMQRAAYDLLGIHAQDSADQRKWLRHGAWPDGAFPLRKDFNIASRLAQADDGYPFVKVEGEGVHEIPVGPVHAGIIKPGHFRFSVVGEKVLRLEEHLGYTHKGIERRFTELAPLDAHRLAGRISGDSTVAYAWAYCMALESAWRCEIPVRATWLRALMLERERVANHLGDLGALGNDAALAFGLAQFSRLREDWQRLSKEAFGHRFMMDAVVPGGVAIDLVPPMLDRLRQQCDDIERGVRALKAVYDEHAGLQDRFLGTGRVTPQLAAQLGLTGLAGRASGQATDLRCDHEWAPYDRFEVAMATHRNGDVAARVTVRFEETFESLRLIRAICLSLPDGAARADLQPPAAASMGAGWVEGWR